MKDEKTKVDLGSVQIHKKVLADITVRAVSDIDGVNLIPSDLQHTFLEMIGKATYPGVVVHVDKNSQVTIEAKVVVRFGLNIPELARHIQDAIRSAIEKTVDINLKEVNVNIQGIERGQ